MPFSLPFAINPEEIERSRASALAYVAEMREVVALGRAAGEDMRDLEETAALIERATNLDITPEEAVEIVAGLMAGERRAQARCAEAAIAERDATERCERARARLDEFRVETREMIFERVAYLGAWLREAEALARFVPTWFPDRRRLLAAMRDVERQVADYEAKLQRLDDEDRRLRARDAEDAARNAAVAASADERPVVRARVLFDAQQRRRIVRPSKVDHRNARNTMGPALHRLRAARHAPRARARRRVRRCARAPSAADGPSSCSDGVAAWGTP